jgi:hypothetical protein
VNLCPHFISIFGIRLVVTPFNKSRRSAERKDSSLCTADRGVLIQSKINKTLVESELKFAEVLI